PCKTGSRRSRPAPAPASAGSAACLAWTSGSSRRLTFEAIPDAPDSRDEFWVGGIFFDLLAQPADVDRQRMSVAEIAPEALVDLIACEDLTRILSQQLQNVEFARRDRHGLAFDTYLASTLVDLDPSVIQH